MALRVHTTLNSLDPDFYLDLHQIAHTHRSQSPTHVWWNIVWEINENVEKALYQNMNENERKFLDLSLYPNPHPSVMDLSWPIPHPPTQKCMALDERKK